MNNVNWTAVAEELENASKGESVFVFPPKGKIIVKIKALGVNDKTWFEKFFETYEYQGKEVTALRFVFYGIVIQINGEVVPSERRKVQIIKVPMTAMKQIFTTQGNGWDVLTPENGHPVSITRTQDNQYFVQPAAKVYDSTYVEMLEDMMTLTEAIEVLTKPKDSKLTENKPEEIEW